MSRIGKKPITIPQGVEVRIEDGFIKVKGPRGELTQTIHPKIKFEKKDNQLIATVKNSPDKAERALWGLFGSLAQNMVRGVSEGFEKKLEVNGVGYKVALSGNKLTLHVGYSHPVDFQLPESISAEVEKNIITIKGIDKQQVGQIAAEIRAIRKPEPYKGKGIKYLDEVIRRKSGKTAAAGKSE